jgi:hypothetical protein
MRGTAQVGPLPPLIPVAAAALGAGYAYGGLQQQQQQQQQQLARHIQSADYLYTPRFSAAPSTSLHPTPHTGQVTQPVLRFAGSQRLSPPAMRPCSRMYTRR